MLCTSNGFFRFSLIEKQQETVSGNINSFEYQLCWGRYSSILCTVTHCFSLGYVLKSVSVMIYTQDDLFLLLRQVLSIRSS